jgi:hypothetical protein
MAVLLILSCLCRRLPANLVPQQKPPEGLMVFADVRHAKSLNLKVECF